MTTATGRTRCVTCDMKKATIKCEGYSQDFCFNHVADHLHELRKQLDEVEVSCDLFRQTLTEQIAEPQKHPLIQQVDQWERDAVFKIQQTAKEARQILLQHNTEHIKQLEIKLNKLTDELRQKREENDFFETDLCRWTEELTRLTAELNETSDINFRHDSTPLVTTISVDVSGVLLCFPNTDTNVKSAQNGITVAGDNGEGNELNQLAYPNGIYVHDDRTIYIADCNNHRIVEWNTDTQKGQVVAGGNEQGDRPDQLNCPTDVVFDEKSDCVIICDQGNQRVMQWPRQNGTSGQTIISKVACYGVAMDNEGCFYVSDSEKHEVRRWRTGDTVGKVVAGGNGEGNRLDQLNYPTYIFIDRDHSVYVSDIYNHRVMKWMKGAKEGIVVAGNQGQGNSLTQLSYPNGIIVDKLDTVYVVDSSNHRVMRWPKGATEGSIVIGRDEKEKESDQLSYPIGLSFDQRDNIYISDSNNRRVQKFSIDPTSSFHR